MKTLLPFIFILGFLPGQDWPTAEQVLAQVDANMVAGNRMTIATMVIHGRRDSRTLQIQSWIQGEDRSFSEYLSPPGERGIKMLKLKDELWTYSPQSDRTIRIAGHMLRQSLNGSDLSYEDMLEDNELLHSYTAVLLDSGRVADRPCWILELTAKRSDVTYHSRRIWVDRERFIALQEERFAKSGKLLKTTRIEEMFFQDERWYPRRITFQDMLKKGGGTELILDSLNFDIVIPDHLFTRAALRQ